MAVNDDATLVIGAGNFFTAAVDTVPPVDYTAPGGSWTNVGHTSLEDIFGVSSEGGEATTLATLQNRTLRTTYSARTEAFNITLQQFDEASLKLYFGSNMETLAGGELGVMQSPTATEAAFLAVFIDGANVFGIYVPKCEIFRGEDVEFADAESLAGLPITVKPLKSGSNAWTYAVTPLAAV